MTPSPALQLVATPAPTVAPSIAVPAHLEVRLQEVTLRTAERLGCSVQDARRLVEVAVVTRGIDLLEREVKA